MDYESIVLHLKKQMKYYTSSTPKPYLPAKNLPFVKAVSLLSNSFAKVLSAVNSGISKLPAS